MFIKPLHCTNAVAVRSHLTPRGTFKWKSESKQEHRNGTITRDTASHQDIKEQSLPHCAMQVSKTLSTYTQLIRRFWYVLGK